jgi:hypothetical protein
VCCRELRKWRDGRAPKKINSPGAVHAGSKCDSKSFPFRTADVGPILIKIIVERLVG